MKAFITGATGFIGSHLADALLADERYTEVRCLVRKNKKWLGGKPVKKYAGDLHDLPVLKKAVKGVDVVFHLAGVVKAPNEETFLRTNVDATENLMRVVQKQGVPKMVVLSSLAAVGPSSGQAVNEESPMKPVSMYGRSKKKMEQMIHNIVDKKLSVTILRPSAVYGPREEQIYSFFKMADKRICPIIGDGNHPKISMVYVDDVVQACLKATKQRNPGVITYFISGEPILSWEEVRRTTEQVLHKKTFPIHLKPKWVTKAAGLVEKGASFFGVYPVINSDKAKELILEWTCSIKKAKKELNFEPQYSLTEGISKTIGWYKRHHWL